MYALAARVAAVTVVLLAAGCGPGTGQVWGKVTYLGKPVPGGRITFRPADPAQNAVSAELDEDGKFAPVTLPTGDVTVCIDNREFEPVPGARPAATGIPLPPELARKLGQKATGPAPEVDPTKTADPPPRPRSAARYLKIPEKYYEVESSGLKFQVTGGNQEKDFELTD